MNRLISIGFSVAVAPAIYLAIAQWTSSSDGVYVSEVALFDIALPLGGGLIITGLIQSLFPQFFSREDDSNNPVSEKKIQTHWIFQYQHITGCIFGLISLYLFSKGWFGKFWPITLVGSYSIGWWLADTLMAKPSKPLAQKTIARAHPLSDGRAAILAKVEKRIPENAFNILIKICQCGAELRPRLETNPARIEELKLLERVIEVYLPITLDNYLKLPAEFAKIEMLSDGKTAEELLLEQLNLLAEHLHSMLKEAVMNDARTVIENGLFLEERFKAANSFFETK